MDQGSLTAPTNFLNRHAGVDDVESSRVEHWVASYSVAVSHRDRMTAIGAQAVRMLLAGKCASVASAQNGCSQTLTRGCQLTGRGGGIHPDVLDGLLAALDDCGIPGCEAFPG